MKLWYSPTRHDYYTSAGLPDDLEAEQTYSFVANLGYIDVVAP